MTTGIQRQPLNTGLIKVFEVLKGIQDDIVLDGTVYLDETYFSKAKQNKIKKDGKEL